MKMLKRFRMNNLPIRYKLIIHFLLISILPSIGLGFLVNLTVERIIEKQVNENTLQLIGKVNRSLEFYVSNMQNITYFISFNPDIRSFLEQDDAITENEQQRYEIRKFLQGFTTLYSEVAGILVVNHDGEYVSNEMYALSTKDLTRESWYVEAVENKGIFTIIGHPEGRNVTTHVNYEDDEVVSVVAGHSGPGNAKSEGRRAD